MVRRAPTLWVVPSTRSTRSMAQRWENGREVLGLMQADVGGGSLHSALCNSALKLGSCAPAQLKIACSMPGSNAGVDNVGGIYPDFIHASPILPLSPDRSTDCCDLLVCVKFATNATTKLSHATDLTPTNYCYHEPLPHSRLYHPQQACIDQVGVETTPSSPSSWHSTSTGRHSVATQASTDEPKNFSRML